MDSNIKSKFHYFLMFKSLNLYNLKILQFALSGLV